MTTRTTQICTRCGRHLVRQGTYCPRCDSGLQFCLFCGAAMQPQDRVDECSHAEGKGGAAAS